MKTIHQSECLKNVKYDIRGRVSVEAEKMSAAGINILTLNTGNPAAFGFHAPDCLVKSMMDNMVESQAYSLSQGQYAARDAVAAYSKEKGLPDVTREDVILGNGVSELIIMAVQALVNSGDEVLIPTPDYPLWTAAVYLCGGKPVHYLCDEEADWYPDIADMRSKITSRTKAIVLINPNNPTGALYSKELLEEVIKLAREHKLIIFSDEIYDRLLLGDEDQHVSTGSLADDVLTVTFNGLSKSHCITGFRSGWICFSGDRESTRDYIDGVKLLASIRVCSNVPAQSVIPAAFACQEEAKGWLRPDGLLYQQRDYITQVINSIPGLSAVKPKAAMYIFPKIDSRMYRVEDDEDFVLQFLRQHNILITHGGAYNWKKPDHFRIVYLPSVEQLSALSGSMERFLQQYKR